MAEPYLTELTNLIAGLAPPIPEGVSLECKHFFSGAALYANGNICASLTPAGLGVKLPAEIRERLLAQGQAGELRYFENGPIKKEFVLLDPVFLQEREKLVPLLAQSIRFAAQKS